MICAYDKQEVERISVLKNIRILLILKEQEIENLKKAALKVETCF